MNSFRSLFERPRWQSFVVLVVLHFAAMQVSFFCGRTPENEVIIWLPNSVLLVALLRFPLPFGLATALLTFLTNIFGNLTGASLVESTMLSLVNLIEVGLTWRLMLASRASPNLTRVSDLARFVVAGPLVGAFVSGLLGALVIQHFGSTTSYLTLMRVWWFDDGLGLMVFAPILMLASTHIERNPRLKPFDLLMLAAILLVLGTLYVTVQRHERSYAISPSLIIPFALMLALRFEIVWTAIGVALITLAVSKLAAMGLNPFGGQELNYVVIKTQEFILTTSIICMGASVFRRELLMNERNLERMVSERTADLATSLAQLKSMQEELIQSAKLASLGSLVAGVAHELNTPIGIAVLAASTLRQRALELKALIANKTLKRSALDEFASDLLEETDLIERSIERADRLVASFKQIAVDQTSEQKRQFDLLQLISENLLTLLPLIDKNNLNLLVDVAEPISMVSFPGPLGQVVNALTSNALIHAFAGRTTGQIVIRAQRRGHHVMLEFADDGIGMNDQTAARVFDPFFTTRLGSGTSGLGLFIVKNIVTGILGGTISVKSSPQNGTRVEMMLPVEVVRD